MKKRINPRALGLNPRALGVNPRALGVNPRALGVNPRGHSKNLQKKGGLGKVNEWIRCAICGGPGTLDGYTKFCSCELGRGLEQRYQWDKAKALAKKKAQEIKDALFANADDHINADGRQSQKL